MGITVESKVQKKRGFENVPFFQVKQVVKEKGKKDRIFTDCKHFSSKEEAINAIPSLDKDLKESIEQGVI